MTIFKPLLCNIIVKVKIKLKFWYHEHIILCKIIAILSTHNVMIGLVAADAVPVQVFNQPVTFSL